MSNPFAGRIFWHGDEQYEQNRRAATWHAGTPNRFPAVIVQATNTSDVVAAIRLAREKGMKMAVRSGGHSWSGSHLREGIVLLDISRLRDCSIDREAMTATAQPGQLAIVLTPTSTEATARYYNPDDGHRVIGVVTGMHRRIPGVVS